MPLSDDDQKRIQSEQRRLRDELDAIRGDSRLTDAGKRIEMAKAYKRASGEARKVRERVKAEDARKRADLEPVLFGAGNFASSTDTMAFRDGLARARACRNADDLARLMEDARRSGDRLQLKAGFTVAWDRSDDTTGRGYIPLVEEVLATDPAVGRLAEIYLGHQDDPVGLMPDVARPNELHGVNVDHLAAQAPEPAAS